MATFSHMIRTVQLYSNLNGKGGKTKVKSIPIDFYATDKVFNLLIATQMLLLCCLTLKTPPSSFNIYIAKVFNAIHYETFFWFC